MLFLPLIDIILYCAGLGLNPESASKGMPVMANYSEVYVGKVRDAENTTKI